MKVALFSVAGVAGLWIAGMTAVSAQEQGPPPEVRAGCLSATDDCRVCRISNDGAVVGCSFPGIACAPTAWRCNGDASSPPPEPGPEAEKGPPGADP